MPFLWISCFWLSVQPSLFLGLSNRTQSSSRDTERFSCDSNFGCWSWSGCQFEGRSLTDELFCASLPLFNFLLPSSDCNFFCPKFLMTVMLQKSSIWGQYDRGHIFIGSKGSSIWTNPFTGTCVEFVYRFLWFHRELIFKCDRLLHRLRCIVVSLVMRSLVNQVNWHRYCMTDKLPSLISRSSRSFKKINQRRISFYDITPHLSSSSVFMLLLQLLKINSFS